MKRFFYLVLLACIFLGASEKSYFYSHGKKVYVSEAKKFTRSTEKTKCYDNEVIKNTFCLEDEIIIQSSKKALTKALAKHDILFVKSYMNDLHLVRASDADKTLELANTLTQEKGIDYAYPNFSNMLTFRADTTPLALNDAIATQAWHLKNYGQGPNYKIGADIKIEEAWKYTLGDAVRVGIIDDGIDKFHEDVDYVDGYSVNNPAARLPFHSDSNTANHGTQVATLIAGKKNDRGSVGVAPESRLYVVNIDRSSNVSQVVEAFLWMERNGVQVITNSWGSHNVPDPITRIVTYLLTTSNSGRGIPIVFAVGNDSKNLDAEGINDESEIPGVIAVGGSTPFDNRYHKSDYGENLTLVAPATDLIVGRKFDKGVNTELAEETCAVKVCLNKGGTQIYTNATESVLYMKESGTSLAAPIVAGGIALMVEVNPNLTTVQIKEILQNTADKIATNEYGGYDVNGRNPYYGYGRLNLEDAVKESNYLATIEGEAGDFTLKINKGWNLLAMPVNQTLHQKDFGIFGFDTLIQTVDNNAFNSHVKVIFPEQGFFLYSPSATQVNFYGYEYNTSFETVQFDQGWNLIGVGEESNITTIKSKVRNIESIYLFRNGEYTFPANDQEVISRGEGLLIYKL